MNLDQVRRDMVATCLALAEKGYLPGTGGNVACRINDEQFAITPSAMDYYVMGPEDICVLRLDNVEKVAGDRQPSVEHRLHAHVLRSRKDCGASIHTHQPIASAYTLLGRELDVLDPRHQAILGRKAALVEYAPSGTGWLASKLSKRLSPEINAYLLRNHGIVCCGPTLDETVRRVEALEAACSAFFRNEINRRMDGNSESSLPEVLRLLADACGMERAQ